MSDLAALALILYCVIGFAVGATWPVWVWFLGN